MTESTHKLEPTPQPGPTRRGHVSLLFTLGDQLHAAALREGESMVVGRAEPAQLALSDKSLSRVHARLSARDGLVLLEDLGSTNGCSVNGARVTNATLSDDDVALLGSVELRVSGCFDRGSQHSRALSHAAFMRRVGDELTRARVFGRCVSILAIRGMGAEQRSSVAGALRPVDAECLFGPALTVLLLPELDAREAELLWRTHGHHQGSSAGIASYPLLTCTAEELLSRALDAAHAAKLGTVCQAKSAETGLIAGPLIRSAAMQRVYDLVNRAARTTLPVLVRGETGSGKELVARAVHEKSGRAKGPFKALNCATIPANLIESVLFGHERGAFTGADRQTQGIFEQAQGGTVFLDEVGELAPQAQAALLRVLELRKIVRVGGTKEIDVDARVVAATHRDLSAMVQTGTFREDLMFRLDALTLRVPPLRERREEIRPLAELFLARAREQWGAAATRLSDDAVDALEAYKWPGNVRQLKNVVERAVAVCAGEVVELEDLPEQVWMEGRETFVPAEVQAESQRSAPGGGDGFKSLPDRVREFEVGLIREALEKAHGNQAQAARILGVPRRTLANKVHAYGLV